MATESVLQSLKQRFPDLDLTPRALVTYPDGRNSGQFWLAIPPARLIEICRFLRNDPACLMEQLTDVTCVDYLNFPEQDWITGRFGVTYGLLSLTHNHRLWLKVFVDDPEPKIPSVTSIWKGANWTEREVYDMFGVVFTGHPDLRRILMPEGFQDHPLRKDYPLRGKGEREAFPVITRDSA